MTAITDAKCNFLLLAALSVAFGISAPSKISKLVTNILQNCSNDSSETSLFTACNLEVGLATAYTLGITSLFAMTMYYGYKAYYIQPSVTQTVTCLNKTN